MTNRSLLNRSLLLLCAIIVINGTCMVNAQPTKSQLEAKKQARAEATALLGAPPGLANNPNVPDVALAARQLAWEKSAARLEAHYAKKAAIEENMETTTRKLLSLDAKWWEMELPSDPSHQGRSLLDTVFRKYQYKEVVDASLKFYQAQRSGAIRDTEISWRFSDHLNDTIKGGLFDAGDNLKLPFTLSPTVSMMAWSLIEFKGAYNDMDNYATATKVLKRAASYLLKSLNTTAGTFIGQIGDPNIDHNNWLRPEEDVSIRPALVYNSTMGASDLFAGTAAAMASSSVVFKESYPKFSARLLKSAVTLYGWAKATEGKYSNYYTRQTKSIYPSSDYLDALAWAGCWLFNATGDTSYLNDTFVYWSRATAKDIYSGWDSQWGYIAVFMANLESRGIDVNVYQPGQFSTWLNTIFFRGWLVGDEFEQIVYTPKGMAYPKWSEWGNLQFSTTSAFLALVRARYTNDTIQQTKLVNYGKQQVQYAMGSSGRSFIIGYGVNPPQYAHHAGSSCPDRPAICDWTAFESPLPNPQMLKGGLVGGPGGFRVNATDPDNSFVDRRSNYNQNEVALDYSVGLLGAAAALSVW